MSKKSKIDYNLNKTRQWFAVRSKLQQQGKWHAWDPNEVNRGAKAIKLDVLIPEEQSEVNVILQETEQGTLAISDEEVQGELTGPSQQGRHNQIKIRKSRRPQW